MSTLAPLKSSRETGLSSWLGRVNSGALVPASSWGMVLLTTVREWGHNSAFAHTVSSSPLTRLAAWSSRRSACNGPAVGSRTAVTIRGERTSVLERPRRMTYLHAPDDGL